MMKGAKTWEEMRAELPLEVRRRLDERLMEFRKSRALEEENETQKSPPRKSKPAA